MTEYEEFGIKEQLTITEEKEKQKHSFLIKNDKDCSLNHDTQSDQSKCTSPEQSSEENEQAFYTGRNENSTPSADVKVEPSVDITPERNSGVMKQMLKNGIGNETPGYGDKVIVHYTGWLLDGKKSTVFDSSRNRDKFEFVIGKGMVIKGWDLGVPTMKKGEIAIFICRPSYAYGDLGNPPVIPPLSTLVFEIELFDWKLEDLSIKKDGGILRKVLIKGEGSYSPNEGALVKAHLVGSYNNRTFEERDVEFLLGEGGCIEIPEGVEMALIKFKKAEKSRLFIKSKYAFNYQGKSEYGIPSNADVEYEVILESFEKAKEVWEMDSDEKLEQSKKAKEKGTTYFKMGSYSMALKQYKRIVTYLENEPGVSPDEEKPRTALLLAGYLNMALCFLKLENYLDAIKSCDKVLDVEPQNEKALYRRGQGRQKINDCEQALSDFKEVLTINPENKAARNNILLCQDKIKKQKTEERKTYSNMFKKFAQADEDYRKKQQLVQTETGVWEGGERSDITHSTLNDETIVRMLNIQHLPLSHGPNSLY